MSVLYDLLNNIGLDARLEPVSTGEVAMAMTQLGMIRKNDVFSQWV